MSAMACLPPATSSWHLLLVMGFNCTAWQPNSHNITSVCREEHSAMVCSMLILFFAKSPPLLYREPLGLCSIAREILISLQIFVLF